MLPTENNQIIVVLNTLILIAVSIIFVSYDR